MTELLQVVKEVGLPYGVLLAGILVLWREVRRLQQKCEELWDRLSQSGRKSGMEELLRQLEERTEGLAEAVQRLLRRRETKRTQGTEETQGRSEE